MARPRRCFTRHTGKSTYRLPSKLPREPRKCRWCAMESNIVSLGIASRAPRLLLLGGSPYGAITNFSDGSIAAPAGLFPGVNTHPAHVGDTLTIYAIGLGVT